jgi:hypothetical protein
MCREKQAIDLVRLDGVAGMEPGNQLWWKQQQHTSFPGYDQLATGSLGLECASGP